jgi:hypothetical protein
VGIYVSELRAVPVGIYRYYAYLVDVSENAAHSEEISKALRDLAVKSGAEAMVVQGPRDLSLELVQFLQKHAPSDLRRLEKLFLEVSSLIISEGTLQTTTSQVFVIPLIPRGEDGITSQPLLAKLVDGLLATMHQHTVREFLLSLGAESIELSEIKGGMLIAKLRYLNEILELKPSFAGLGVNLNRVIERILGPAVRPLPE